MSLSRSRSAISNKSRTDLRKVAGPIKESRSSIKEEGEETLQNKLSKQEIKVLKQSWFEELVPEFPEDIVGRQYINISDAIESDAFWNQIVEIMDVEAIELLNESMSLNFHQTTCFVKTLKISMVSIENLQNLDSYFQELGLTHLRIFNTSYESFQFLKKISLELLKLSFADAFDLTLQHCWCKLFDIIIDKMTDCQDFHFINAEFIYANENALIPTILVSKNGSGDYYPTQEALETAKKIPSRKKIDTEKKTSVEIRTKTLDTYRPKTEKTNVTSIKRFKNSLLGRKVY